MPHFRYFRTPIVESVGPNDWNPPIGAVPGRRLGLLEYKVYVYNTAIWQNEPNSSESLGFFGLSNDFLLWRGDVAKMCACLGSAMAAALHPTQLNRPSGSNTSARPW